MERDELSAGSARLVRSIKKRYADLSTPEARRLGGIVLDEVGKRISAGEQLAFLRRNPDGDAELTVIGLEILRRKQEGRRK